MVQAPLQRAKSRLCNVLSREQGGNRANGCARKQSPAVHIGKRTAYALRSGTTMPRRISFTIVESIGRTLPDVESTTTFGKPALKVRGKMFVCIASNKSAEPNTLVVMMDFADRDALIADDPDTYYLKDHYLGYPCVLVRLSRVRADALRDLVIGAHRFVSARSRTRPARRTRPSPNPRRIT